MALSRRRTALVDAVAITAFVAAGVATHGASVGAFCRDAACLLGAWFATACAARLYARGGWQRLAVTWLVGITEGVFIRAAIVDRWPGAFYGVALGFTALFVAIARLLATRLPWTRPVRTRPVPGTVTAPSRERGSLSD